MYTRRLSALLALPIMALLISLVGGIPGNEILSKVFGEGSLKLHNAYTTTMFGAVLAELINKQGIAKSLIRWVAEFAGDNPFVLGILLTATTALLFSTLGGLGAVIMVGTIVLPVMMSLEIPTLTAGALFLFGISIGGMFNLSNWQVYTDILGINRSQIIEFVIPFAGVMGALVLTFLGMQLKMLKSREYIAALLGLMLLGYILSGSFHQGRGDYATQAADAASLAATSIVFSILIIYAAYRHWRKVSSMSGLALATPFIPLLLVLFCRWDIIPAFLAGIAYGALITWQHNSITMLTRSILDGISTVIPAVALMIGIGMLLAAVMHPQVANAMAPLLTQVVPTHAIPYVTVFTIAAPLSLYRGPLSLWGMGSGLVALIQKTTALGSQAIMGMLLSVGQVQGICDPTSTHIVWTATYLGTDTQALLARTIPYVWVGVFLGLCLAVILGYVPW
ncbi:MAG: citrate transporter [Candidatus Melainabacteria bacterium]|nr:citrate transporter [Candidatus Melainabacteria bacterium]